MAGSRSCAKPGQADLPQDGRYRRPTWPRSSSFKAKLDMLTVDGAGGGTGMSPGG